MMMLFQMSQADITTPRGDHCKAGELEGIITSIPAPHKKQQEAKHCEPHIAQSYWFRCPACKFDWQQWIKPSIIFVSLSSITDTCPNCRTRHVPACGMVLNPKGPW